MPSLVGSEMCIRDRSLGDVTRPHGSRQPLHFQGYPPLIDLHTHARAGDHYIACKPRFCCSSVLAQSLGNRLVTVVPPSCVAEPGIVARTLGRQWNSSRQDRYTSSETKQTPSHQVPQTRQHSVRCSNHPFFRDHVLCPQPIKTATPAPPSTPLRRLSCRFASTQTFSAESRAQGQRHPLTSPPKKMSQTQQYKQHKTHEIPITIIPC